MIVRFADVEIDRAAMRVRRAGELVTLEPRAYDVLVYLVKRPGQLVEKESLIRDVWRGTAVTDNAITRVIAQLRRALGDTAHQPRFIETVPTRGYRFIAETREDALPFGDTGPQPGSAPSRWPRRLVAALALAGGVAGLGMAGVWLLTRSEARGTTALAAVDLAFSASFPRQLTVSAGLDIFPAVSPDGTSVAYASDRSGRFEIVVRALGPGGGERFLTTDGLQNVQPAWSPDGRLIAYHARLPGGIWVVSSQGGVPRQVSPIGSAPSWSPDGSRLAFQSAPLTDLGPSAGAAMPPSTIWIVGASGGEPSPVTQPGQPAGGHGRPIWFRDGTQLLFVNGGPMTRDLWSVPVGGGPSRRVVKCEPSCLDPFFGPDRHLYYTDGQVPRVWRVELDRDGRQRGSARALTVPVGGTVRGVSISSAGTVAAFASIEIRSNLMSVEVDPAGQPVGEPRQVTNDRSRRNTWPAVSPDGQRIAYIAGRTGVSPNVWIVQRDGSAPEQLTLDAGGEGGPMWSADGRAILFKAWRSGRLVLRAVDVQTRRQRDVLTFDHPLTRTDTSYGLQAFTMRASPDRARLAFTGSLAGVPNIFVSDARSGPPRQLTHDREGVSFPVYSPAANLLAVQVHRSGDTHAGLVDTGSGALRQLTRTGGQTWVHDWSPDGSFISAAALREGVWNVALVSRATGAERLVTREVSPRIYVRYPAWSPRGDFIVCERAEITGNIWTSELTPASSTRAGIW